MRAIKPEEVHHCRECGAEAQMTWNGKEFSVWCMKCKNAVYALTQEKALADWNQWNPESDEVKPFTETGNETPETLPKLKPCPFCGGTAGVCECEYPRVYGIENKPYYVQCSCGVTLGYDLDYGGTFDTEREAIEAWNQRTGE